MVDGLILFYTIYFIVIVLGLAYHVITTLRGPTETKKINNVNGLPIQLLPSANPYYVQRDILRKYEAQNQLAYEKYQELVLSGHSIAHKSKIEGPYVTHETFVMTNGQILSFLLSSSLDWFNQKDNK